MPKSFNGTGTMFYGKDIIASDGSYVTTEWVTFFWFPLVPFRSYRVLPYEDGGDGFVYSSQRYWTQAVPLKLGSSKKSIREGNRHSRGNLRDYVCCR